MKPVLNFSRFPLFAVVAALLPVLAADTAVSDESTRLPNIVFILADDLGYGDVSCYNEQAKAQTRHMDRLAGEGMRFTDAYAPAAVCVPTRYGVLTGRYPFRAELNWRNKSVVSAGRMTIGSLLQQAGYVTGCVGKWHQGFDVGQKFTADARLTGGPIDRGFGSYFGLHASLDIPPYFYIRDDRCVKAPTESIGDSSEPGMSIKYQGKFWRAGKIAPDFRHEETLDLLADEAVAFLRRQKQQTKPFFLYFPLTAPHGPWVPSEKYRGRSDCGKYGDFLVHTDEVIGRVLKALDDLEFADNTLVIVTSDNGPLWFDPDVKRWGHRASYVYRGRKGDIWDGGVRMPLLVRWPGKTAAGAVSGEVVGLTDLLATFAELVDRELPEDAGADSVSFLPVLLGKNRDKSIREELIVQSTGRNWLAIRSGPWKLIPWLGSGGFLTKPRTVQPQPGEPKGQLYHLGDDPGEQNNLYAKHPDVVDRLSKRLNEIKQSDRSR